MSLISREEFASYKKTSTIVVYGCGDSINSLTDKNKKKLLSLDSVGFNWFCFSKIPTTYYIIREQANLPKRVHGKENVDNFVNIMSQEPYSNSCLIIHNLSKHSPYVVDYSSTKYKKKFNKFIIIRDRKLQDNSSGVNYWGKRDIFDYGLIHGKCTFNNVLHFIIQMDYKKILFVGIDLYDSRYFWIKKGRTRYTVKDKKQNYKSQHFTSSYILDTIREMKKVYPSIKMYTYNSKSLLRKVIKVWPGKWGK